eukprot:4590176-Karenia_brevis.AAC.1
MSLFTRGSRGSSPSQLSTGPEMPHAYQSHAGGVNGSYHTPYPTTVGYHTGEVFPEGNGACNPF